MPIKSNKNHLQLVNQSIKKFHRRNSIVNKLRKGIILS